VREIVSTNQEILLKLQKVENQLWLHQEKVNNHSKNIAVIFQYLKKLLTPPKPEREPIGF
jgi:hypothetical protein